MESNISQIDQLCSPPILPHSAQLWDQNFHADEYWTQHSQGVLQI